LKIVELFLVTVALASTQRAVQAQQGDTLRVREISSWVPVIGFGFGAPYRESVYFGAARMTHLSTDVEVSRGIAGVAELGRGVGQVGIARAWENEGLMTRLQAEVLRTWGHPSHLAANQTFVGVLAQTSFVLGLSGGYYWRVNGDAAGDAHFASVRFVVGF
jgi:hypothetical protein